MHIGIVITTKNGLSFNKACVNSIVCSHPYDLIIVDDGSVDGTIEWAESLENAIVLKDLNEPSLGAKWNKGAEKAFELGAEAALICNNDILFSPLTIDALISRMEKARTNKESVVMVSAHNLRGKMSTGKLLQLRTLPWEPSESDGPDFSCFLLHRVAFEQVSKFPTIYIPCYFEDNDYHITLSKAGCRAITTTSAPYHHYGSITQNSVPGGLCPGPQFELNRQVFEQKFGFATTSQEYRDTIAAAREGKIKCTLML